MTYYEDDGSWLWPEEEALPGQQDGKEGVASSTQERREDHTQSTEDFYKGGGKGKGKFPVMDASSAVASTTSQLIAL